MAPNRLMQPSFAGGEISPRLHARIDLTKYKTGARLLKNFIIHPHGGASKRPGFQFVAEVKDSTKPVRLVPFVASTDDAYIWELGHQYLRFFRNGGRVMNAGNTAPYEIATPWLDFDLPYIKFAQSNDIMTAVHEDFAVREIARYDHNNWIPTTVSFAPSIAAPGVVTLARTQGYTGADYVGQNYTYAATAVNADGDESLIGASATIANDLRYYPANTITVTVPATTGADRYNIYRFENGLWGFVGSAKPTATGGTATWSDKNMIPDQTDGPPSGANPFSGAGNNPRVVTFFQQRRIFGATLNKPQTIIGSQSGNYYNMTASIPAKPSDKFEFAMASRSIQKIHHLVPLGDLLIFTKSTEWKMTGGEGELVTPSSASIRPQSNYGSDELLEPIQIGDQVLFVEDKGWRVRDIGYRYDVDKYTGSDLTILADHLFRGRRIVSWAYANIPYSAVWCVMDDGTLTALTYLREHEVWGWSRHETDGFIENVAVIPEGGEDVPYFVIKRFVNGTWKRYIEKLHAESDNSRHDAFFVDSGLTYDVPQDVSAVAQYLGTMAITTYDPHNLAAGNVIHMEHNHGAYESLMGSHYRVRAVLNTTQFSVENLDGSDVVDELDAWSEHDFVNDFVYIRKKVTTLSGLGHLEGRQVVGLADGRVIGMDAPITVSGGSITLPFAAARVHVGLPYDADFESLEMQAGDQLVVGQKKNITRVRIRVAYTSGIEVGPSFDQLQWERGLSEDAQSAFPEPPLTTGDIEILPQGKWTEHGRVCIRQRFPLPATLLGLVPDIEYGKA